MSTRLGKWNVRPASCGPGNHCLGRIWGTAASARLLHLAVAEPYPTSLCKGQPVDLVDPCGPGYRLCPACAALAGVERASDLPVDPEEAAFWQANEAMLP